jgi:hypothetical protein
MSTAAKLPSASDVMLTILSGPETGVGYKVVGQTVTIGRAPENDVVLQDSKSSRTHAQIEFREGAYWIKDLGSQNGILINGANVREGILRPGDQVTVGSTLMRFGPAQPLGLVAPLSPSPLSKRSNPLGAANPEGAGWLPPLAKTSKRPPAKNNMTYIIVGVLIFAGILIFMERKNARKALGIKDDAAVQEEILRETETNEKRKQEILRTGKNTQQYAEAQAFYLRGFRDFRESNFARAIQNFEAALALYPEHPLAKRYLDRSRLKLNETVTASLERGERAFSLQKYSIAMNEYRTVVLLTGDPSNSSYQLALKRIEAIKLIILNNK